MNISPNATATTLNRLTPHEVAFRFTPAGAECCIGLASDVTDPMFRILLLQDDKDGNIDVFALTEEKKNGGACLSIGAGFEIRVELGEWNRLSGDPQIAELIATDSGQYLIARVPRTQGAFEGPVAVNLATLDMEPMPNVAYGFVTRRWSIGRRDEGGKFYAVFPRINPA